MSRHSIYICNMMLLLRRENGIIIHGELFSIMNRIGIGGATLLSPIFCFPKFRIQKQNAKLELLLISVEFNLTIFIQISFKILRMFRSNCLKYPMLTRFRWKIQLFLNNIIDFFLDSYEEEVSSPRY